MKSIAAVVATGIVMSVAGCDCTLHTEHVAPPHDQIDVFPQKTAALVDVLWVVDSSASMTSEQGKVAARFAQFFDELLTSQVDYHVGVVDCVAAEGGALHAFTGSVDGCDGCRVLTRDVPCDNPDDAASCPAAQVFGDLVHTGTNGTPFEACFDQAVAALVNPPAANAGFLRDDASLDIVFVSDEDEGAKSDGTPVDFYLRTFEGLKGRGNENKVSVAAITGYAADEPVPLADACSVLDSALDTNAANDDPRAQSLIAALGNFSDGCVDEDAVPGDDTAQAETGGRYIELACRSGGVIANICSADYGVALDALGADAAGLSHVFPLSTNEANVQWGADCTPETDDDVNLDCDGNGNTDDDVDGPLCVTATGIPHDATADCAAVTGAPQLVPHSQCGWILGADGDTIEFRGGFLPSAGSDVSVRYAVSPDPCVR